MSARALVLVVVLAAGAGGALAALTAPAARTATPDPALAPAARRAVALVDERRRFGFRVVLAPARPGERARLDARARTITLRLDPRDAAHRVAHDLAHELGHAYDLTRLTPADRAAYLRRRGVPGAAWWPRPGRQDYAVGAGDFAEVFARCHAASPEFRSSLAALPADPCGMLPPGARI